MSRRPKKPFEERAAELRARMLTEDKKRLKKVAKRLGVQELIQTEPDIDDPAGIPESSEYKAKRKKLLQELLAKQNRKVVRIRTVKWTAEEDQKLCWIYQKYSTENAAWSIAASAFPNKTESAVFRRAVELRLVRTRERYRWHDDELTVVEAFSHLSPEAIQRKLVGISPQGLTRTRSAIISQIHNLRFRSNLPGLSKVVLAEALGVSEYSIDQWEKEKRLKSQLLPSLRMGSRGEAEPRIHFYHNWYIWTFLLNNPGLVDLRRVNQTWFMSLCEWGSAIDRKGKRRSKTEPTPPE